jgi:hypothetical protein
VGKERRDFLHPPLANDSRGLEGKPPATPRLYKGGEAQGAAPLPPLGASSSYYSALLTGRILCLPSIEKTNNGRRKSQGKWREEEPAIEVPNRQGKAKRRWTVSIV